MHQGLWRRIYFLKLFGGEKYIRSTVEKSFYQFDKADHAYSKYAQVNQNMHNLRNRKNWNGLKDNLIGHYLGQEEQFVSRAPATLFSARGFFRHFCTTGPIQASKIGPANLPCSGALPWSPQDVPAVRCPVVCAEQLAARGSRAIKQSSMWVSSKPHSVMNFQSKLQLTDRLLRRYGYFVTSAANKNETP